MKNLLLLVLVLAANLGFSQTFTVRGKIVDENAAPVAGASVALQHPWGETFMSGISAEDGRFVFRNVGKGGYKLRVATLGYEPYLQEITLAGGDLALETIALQSSNTVLKEVRIESTVPLAKQSGDTTEFNATAFKVLSDASSEDLLQKIPSVTVENGAIKAQGENIQQVLVDGKPFFGNDPTAALRNLPAEVVEKVQIFDQQSEQAQFTGFSDGNTTKTINIVTKPGMRSGQFGKMYAGYGYDDKYQTGGNINVFDGNRRISFIGMSNNINVQNFSVDDILGVTGSSGGGRRGGGSMRGGGRRGGGSTGDFLVRPQGGIATTHAIGINYSDQWGKSTEVSASYFFNDSRTNAEESTFRQFIDEGAFTSFYDEYSQSLSDNTNHRFNARFEITLDSANSLIVRPRFTAQISDGNSSTLGRSLLGSDLLSQTDNVYRSELTGLNFDNSILWRHRFAKKGRSASLNLSNGYAPKTGENLLQSLDAYFTTPQPSDTLDQRTTLDVNSWNASANLEYTEPVSENAQIIFNYRFSYQQESSDRLTNDFFAPDGGYTLLNEPLSNVFSNDYTTHQGGTGYNFSKGRDLNVNFRVNAQWAVLLNEKTFPTPGTIDQTFFNVLPSASLRYNIDKQHSVRLFYRTRTELPSVEQLQEVVNNANPLQLSVGNANLKQSLQHSLFMRYQSTNEQRGSTFFAMAGGTATNDYIANSTYLPGGDAPIFSDYAVQPGAQITRPVNLDGNYSLRSFVSYGQPIKGLKTNINLDLSYNYARNPGLLDDQINYANNHAVGVGVTFASNISDRIDFTLGFRPSWNLAVNTLQEGANNQFIIQNSRASLNWIVIEGFVLRTDVSHQLYSGLSDAFNQNFWLWNLAIGKKVFKNERGEITLAVNDVLKQNRSIQRNVTEVYIEDVQTNALQQFLMLSFTYNLRHFRTKKAATKNEREGEGPGFFRPPGF